MSNDDRFYPVTEHAPCAICAKPDWCRRSDNGGHECHRKTEPNVNGFRRVAITPHGFGVYRATESRKHVAPVAAAPVLPKKVRVFDSPEAAAESFAEWRNGTVETLYQWTPDWYRARIKTDDAKVFCEITRTADGWVQRGPQRPHPLYRRDELPADGMIFVCEGEKACDAGWSIGLPCVTSGAADSAGLADWSALAGRDVVILPDHDTPGAAYAQKVTRQLHGLMSPVRVRVLDLPGLGDGDDLHEFVHELRDRQDGEEIKSEILQLVTNATASEPEQALADSENDWLDPQVLPTELSAVEPFHYDLLPASLAPWIRDISERAQCPPDFAAIAAMIALATVVGRKIGIRPKRHDDWLVVPNLWGVAIGPPSVMKTPAMEEALRPIHRLEIEAKKAYDEALVKHEAEVMVARQKRKKSEKDVRAALEKGSDPHVIAREAFASPASLPERRRFVVNDSTVEKLGELLNENPNGLLVFRDELVGLLKSLDKDGQEGSRSFYLECWNGTGRFTYDRVLRGTIEIACATLSVLGSIQPGPLRGYLAAAVAGNEGADGLMQRFQLAVYPDHARAWINVDRSPDAEARETAWGLVQRLDSTAGAALGAEIDARNPGAIPFLRFSVAAQQQFDVWRADLEHRLRDERAHPVITAHLAKYRSLIPSLALLIHLADGPTGPVSLVALERAIAWGRYLESHARRIYASAITPDFVEALALSKKLLAGELKDEFSLRDIYHNGWVGLATREAASRAVAVLCDLDWLTEATEDTRGRPRTRYRINPKILLMPKPLGAFDGFDGSSRGTG